MPQDWLIVEMAKRNGPNSLGKGFVVPSSRSFKNEDLGNYKAAMNAAMNIEEPNRTMLYDVFFNVMLDLHLHSIIESRILKVKRSKHMIIDIRNKEEVPELTELFQTQWMEDYLEYLMWSIFWGPTLIEDSDWDENGMLKEVTIVNRYHVKPERGIVVKNEYDTDGTSYLEGNYPTYYTLAGRPTDFGLLAKISPIALAVKYAIGAYSEFTDKFGIPFRTVNTPSSDDDRHKKLAVILENMGSAGWAVLNQDEKIEFLQASGSNPDKVFTELIQLLDDRMTKAVLGQIATTETGDRSGTYGGLQVMKEVAADRHETDKTFVKNTMNNKRIPMLIQQGYPLKDYHKWVWDDSRDIAVEDRVEMLSKLSQFYTIDPEYITEQTGIPIIGVRNNGASTGTEPEDPKPGK